MPVIWYYLAPLTLFVVGFKLGQLNERRAGLLWANLGAAMCLTMALLTGCASTEQHTRTALEVIGATVDPAYEAAMIGCEAKAQALAAEIREQGFRPAYQDSRDKLADRCGKTRAAFDAIRIMHHQAASALEAGLLDQARQLLGKVMQAWAALKGAGDVGR